jgi:hypothetical protein
VIEPDAERLPILDPPSGRWSFDRGTAAWSPS